MFCSYVTDFEKMDLGIDLTANAFRGSIQNTRLFSIFSSFIFCSIIHLFEKRKGAYSCLFISLFKGWFIPFNTKCILFVYLYIDLSKLKAF